MSSPKIPTPIEPIATSEGFITQPWYSYLNAKESNVIALSSTNGVIFNRGTTIITSTTTVPHMLDDPEIGLETTIVLTIPSTQASPVTVKAATDVAIGPSGENALSFDAAASTYEYVRLLGTSTGQYHILYRTTAISVTASS